MRPQRLLACLLLLVGCSPQPSTLTDDQAADVRSRVAAALDDFRRHQAAGAWDSAFALYANDPSFRWVEDGAVRYRSVAEILASLQRLPAGLRIETTYRDVEITALGPGLAYLVAGFDSRFIYTGGQGFRVGGATTMLFGLRPEGWRILGGHVSSPRERRQ